MSLRGQFVCFCGTADISLHPNNLNFKDLGARVTNAGGTVSTGLTSGVTLVIACHATKKAVGRDQRIAQAIHQGTPVVTIDWLLTVFPSDLGTIQLPVYLPISYRSAMCLLNNAISTLSTSGKLVPAGRGATHVGALLRKVAKLAVVAQADEAPSSRVPPSSLSFAQTAQLLYQDSLSNTCNDASISPCSSRSSSVSSPTAPRSYLTVDQCIDVIQMFTKGRSHPSYRPSCPLLSEYRVGPLCGTTICTAGLPKELYDVSVLKITMGGGVFSGRLDLEVDVLLLYALRTDSASNAKSVVVEASAKVEYATAKSIPICDVSALSLFTPIDALQYDPPLGGGEDEPKMFRDAVMEYEVKALRQRYQKDTTGVVRDRAVDKEPLDEEQTAITDTVVVVAEPVKREAEDEELSVLVTQVAASRTLTSSTQGTSTDLVPKSHNVGDNDAEEEEGPIPTFDTYKAKARAAFDSFNHNQPPSSTPPSSPGGKEKTLVGVPSGGRTESGEGIRDISWKSIFERQRERIENDKRNSMSSSAPPLPTSSTRPHRVTSNSNSLQPIALGFQDEGSNSEIEPPAGITFPPHSSFNVVVQTPEMRPTAYSELLPEMAALLDDASASLYMDDVDDKLRDSTNPYSVVPPSPAPRRIATPAQSPRKTLRNSESRAPSRSRHLNIGGLSIRPTQSHIRPLHRDPSLLAIAPPAAPNPQMLDTAARPAVHRVHFAKDKTTMWLIGCTALDTTQIRGCCLRCGFVRVPLLHVSLVSYIVVGSRLTRSEEAMLKQWSDINEFPHVRIVTLKWLGMYSRLLESPANGLSPSEIMEALQSLQFTFRRSHILAAAETPTRLVEQQAAVPVALADMSDRLSLLQMGAVYDLRRKKRAGNRAEEATDVPLPLSTLPALPSTPQRTPFRAPSATATPRAAAAAGGRSLLPPPSPGGVFLGTHIPTSVGPVVGVTTLGDFERITHSIIKTLFGLLPPIPHASLSTHVRRLAERTVFRSCRVKVGVPQGAAEEEQPAVVDTAPNVLSVRINPPGHTPVPTTTRLQFQLFAYHEDTFSKAHSAAAKALLKFGGVSDDGDVIRIPKSGPTLSHLVSTHVRRLLMDLIDSQGGNDAGTNSECAGIKACSEGTTSYTPRGMSIIAPDNRKAIKRIIASHEALMDVGVDVFVRVLSPHHNETSGIQLRPTPLERDAKQLSIQVPYTLSQSPSGAAEGDVVVGMKRDRGADIVVTVSSSMTVQHVTLAYLATQLCFEQQRLYHSAAKVLLLEKASTSNGDTHAERDDVPLGGLDAPLCCELSDSWSLEAWSPVLRALCTVPILRRGSLRAGGTHKLRESAYVTTKRHIKPNASGVCIFILTTGCVPEKVALRNLVVYFVETAIGLLGGTVVGSVELPSTEDTIPISTTTHVLLLDLDRCTILGGINKQPGTSMPSLPEDLLPPVLRHEYITGSLEFVDTASWLASSVEAGYFVDESQREEFSFHLGAPSPIAITDDCAEAQDGSSPVHGDDAHRLASLPPLPCTPPRPKLLTPVPCTPPPSYTMAAEDDLLSDIIEATIRKTAAQRHSMDAASPPPSSATPLKPVVGLPTSAPGTPQSKAYQRPPATLTLVAEKLQRGKTSTPPPTSASCTPSRLQVIDKEESDRVRYIYIISGVRNANHLRAEMKKLCSIHRSGLNFHRKGLTSTPSPSSPPKDGVPDANTYSVTDDVFYADIVVINSVSKRESVLVGIVGRCMLVTEGFLSACLLDRTIHDPAQYLWTPELVHQDSVARSLSLREASMARRLICGHLGRADEPVFATSLSVAVVLYDVGTPPQASDAVDHARALGSILSRGGCRRALLAGMYICPETNEIMCTSLTACREPSPAPYGKAHVLRDCFDPKWPSEVSQLWDTVSSSPSCDIKGTPLPALLQNVVYMVGGQDVFCITYDPTWKHIVKICNNSSGATGDGVEGALSSSTPPSPATYFGPSVKVVRNSILVETLLSPSTASGSASPSGAGPRSQ